MKYRNLKLKFAWLVIFFTGMSCFSFAQITLTIEQALDIAEENNPQMLQAKLSLERTQFLLEASNASLKPQFSMTVNPFGYSQNRRFDNYNSAWYTSKELTSSGTFQAELPLLLTDGTLRLSNTFGWQDSESTRASGTTISKAFSNDLQLRFIQPLFTYNTTKMEMQRLEFDHENAGIRYALQRLTTEQNITRQFYAVYLAKSTLAISYAEFENAKTNYDIIKARVDAHLSAEEELFQAEVNLMNAESSVQSDEVALKNAKDNLKQTLGMPLNEEIDVEVSIEVIPMLIDEEKAINSALASRMEIRQREISIIEADLLMITTKARNEFSGNL